jgi:hypothetical protein
MTARELTAVQDAIWELDHHHPDAAGSILRGIVGRPVLRIVDPIRDHRYNKGCAGSEIDADGKCHTCRGEIL